MKKESQLFVKETMFQADMLCPGNKKYMPA